MLVETTEYQGTLRNTEKYHPEDNMKSKGKLRQDSKETLFRWTISTKWTISERWTKTKEIEILEIKEKQYKM